MNTWSISNLFFQGFRTGEQNILHGAPGGFFGSLSLPNTHHHRLSDNNHQENANFGQGLSTIPTVAVQSSGFHPGTFGGGSLNVFLSGVNTNEPLLCQEQQQWLQQQQQQQWLQQQQQQQWLQQQQQHQWLQHQHNSSFAKAHCSNYVELPSSSEILSSFYERCTFDAPGLLGGAFPAQGSSQSQNPNPNTGANVRDVSADFLNPSSTRDTISDMDANAMNQFVQGMESNASQFVVTIGNGRDSTAMELAEKKLLRRLIKFDFKQLHVSRKRQNNFVRLTFNKTNAPLLPYSARPGGIPIAGAPLEYSSNRTRLLSEVNDRSRYGHLQPGTYWCQNCSCKLQNQLVSSPTIHYAPGKFLTVDEQFTCADKNVIYILFCQICINEGTCAYHIGHTTDLHARMHEHFKIYNNHFRYSVDELQEIVRLGLDELPHPEKPGVTNRQIRRETKVHFGIEHKREHNSGARIAILKRLGPDDYAQDEETAFKIMTDSYNYLGLGRGGLNRPGG